MEEGKGARDAFVHFLNTPLDQLLVHGVEVEEGGEEEPRRRVLQLFRTALEQVPAYRRFIEDQGVADPSAASSSWDVFIKACPLINKSNYLHKYPLHQRCLNGRLSLLDFLHTSSGSSGQPTVWGRSLAGELDIATRFEQLMHDSFRIDEKSTLCVICFPLGVWVGGLFTTLCVRYLGCKGYAITVVTPGNNVAEILKITQALAPMFDQTVLFGYPPFIKGVIDAGNDAKVPWADYHIKLVLAGEVFSEEWRNLVCTRAHIESPNTGVVSLYGTADAAVIGNETPLSVTIRRWLSLKPEVARTLFGKDRLPTLIQYDPSIRYIEVVERKSDDTQREGDIVLTTLSSQPYQGSEACPVIRYDIGDAGGRLMYSQMMAFLKEHQCDAVAESKKVTDRGCRALPFAWVFGRAHWTISLFGANVYVENIMVGLEGAEVNSFVTGKFVLYLHTDEDNNPRVGVHVELVTGVDPESERTDRVADSILRELLRLNSEFAHYVSKPYQRPHVTLHPHGHPTYFPIGVKHKYTH